MLLKTPETKRKSQAKSNCNHTIMSRLSNSAHDCGRVGGNVHHCNTEVRRKESEKFKTYHFRRSVSQSPPCFRNQSGRLARLEQGRQARKLLDAIDPDIFLDSEVKENSNLQNFLEQRQNSNYCYSNKVASPSTFTTPQRTTIQIKERPTSSKKVLFSPTPPRHPNSSRKKCQVEEYP
jgi:hypothetical protein